MNPNLLFNKQGYKKLENFLLSNRFSKIFVLVDSNTHQFCLPPFLAQLETHLEIEIIEMETGEEHKTVETCSVIWDALSNLGADRKSLLINLGGGVVTDLGGFAALAFKRGISFINVPTTLLAMVDASLGGKTGVNLGSLKNQIGIIKSADLVLIDTTFLKSLPASEMRSGLAEMLKHGLIQDEAYWKKLISLEDFNWDDLDGLILESIKIKEAIVEKDPREENLRKSLNYGHTLGHAIESYFLENPKKQKLLHGEAVAAGMVMATFLSSKLTAFPSEKLLEITRALVARYGKIDLNPDDFDEIISLLKFDKKNENGDINFVLLENIGVPILNCKVPNPLLYEAFGYYLEK